MKKCSKPMLGHRHLWRISIGLMLIMCGVISCTSPVPHQRSDQSTSSLMNLPNATPQYEPTSRSGNAAKYVVNGKRYYTRKSRKGYFKQGVASWYGKKFHGRLTASGEVYDMYQMTAAHKTLPLPTYVQVTHLETGKQVVVKINDRGPFTKGRLIDLSYVAALKLNMLSSGTAPVSVRAIDVPLSVTTAVHDNELAHYIQVGAFRERANAQQLQSRLQQQAQLMASIQLSPLDNGVMMQDEWYRVVVGPYPSLAEADKSAIALIQFGIIGMTIVANIAK